MASSICRRYQCRSCRTRPGRESDSPPAGPARGASRRRPARPRTPRGRALPAASGSGRLDSRVLRPRVTTGSCSTSSRRSSVELARDPPPAEIALQLEDLARRRAGPGRPPRWGRSSRPGRRAMSRLRKPATAMRPSQAAAAEIAEGRPDQQHRQDERAEPRRRSRASSGARDFRSAPGSTRRRAPPGPCRPGCRAAAPGRGGSSRLGFTAGARP